MNIVVVDIRHAHEPITCMRTVRQELTTGCPFPEHVVKNAEHKVVVMHESQLRQLRFEQYQKWGSEDQARHFCPEMIAGYRVVVTDEDGGEFCVGCGEVHG